MTRKLMQLTAIAVLTVGAAGCQAVGVSIGAGTGGIGLGVHGQADVDAVSINGQFADTGAMQLAQRD